ncbi:MAG: hypothetical protein QNJ13_09610 [Paracoccaceae bacterium]|nr:hypothetical protein [Paracoccaceae bacterium]
MEDILTYGLLLAWAIMLFVPSLVAALLLAVVMALAATVLIWQTSIDPVTGSTGDPATMFLILAPMAFAAVFVAWPVGALGRFVLRRLKGAGAPEKS